MLTCISMIVLYTTSILLQGIVTMTLWKWWIVPLGVVPISFAYSIGIMAAISYWTKTINFDMISSANTNKEQLQRSLMVLYGFPLLNLVFGWIVLQFV